MFGLQLWIYGSGSKAMDGYSYFNAWDTIRTLHPDQLRPPLYAVFAGLVREIFGERGALAAIAFLQWTAYVASLSIVWRINWRLGVRRPFNVVAVLMFLVFPGMWVLNNVSVPETFCGCGLLLLIWLSDRYMATGRRKYLLWSGAVLIGLIFTKVMYIFLIPVLGVLWGYTCRNFRKDILPAAGIIASAIILTVAYSLTIKRVCTTQGLTLATAWNRYVTLRMEGLIQPDDIVDPVLRERFRPYYEKDPGRWSPGENIYWHETWAFNWGELNSICDAAVSRHRREVFSMTASYFLRTLPFSQFRYVEPGPDPADNIALKWDGLEPLDPGGHIFPLHRYLWFPIWAGWLITSLFSALWITRWIKRRRFPAIPYLIAGAVTVGFSSIIISAPDDWGRLMTSLDYLLPVMLASVLSALPFNNRTHA